MALSKRDMVDMTRGLYMVDYPLFEKYFVESGGDSPMAKHIWMKWKDIHKDDFLAEFGNLDLQNQKIVTNLLNKLIKYERLTKEEKIKISRKAWADSRKHGQLSKLGKVA